MDLGCCRDIYYNMINTFHHSDSFGIFFSNKFYDLNFAELKKRGYYIIITKHANQVIATFCFIL